jgi:hypothetical protein
MRLEKSQKMKQDYDKSSSNIIYWFFVSLTIITLKYIGFLVDPLPMFITDSASYLNTALKGIIPLERSFVYGFIIKLIAVPAHSLAPLILLQVFLSGVNAIFVVYALRHFFLVSPAVSLACGILCAIEPLQLMYERYVLTETVSLFSFAIYTVLMFHYIKHSSLKTLVLVQIAGTCLISLRLSFLPVVMVNTVFVPLLSTLNAEEKNSFANAYVNKQSRLRSRSLAFCIIHLMVSIGLMLSLHSGYRHLNGFLVKKPPAYQYENGLFLISFLSPIIKPADFSYPQLRNNVFDQLSYNLEDRFNRGNQRWRPDGLVQRIRNLFPDDVQVNDVAQETAMNALRRDPSGLILLAIANFRDYWNSEIVSWCMKSDRGDVKLSEEMVTSLRDGFDLLAERLPFTDTLTNQHFLKSRLWYLLLLCTPLFAFIFLFFCKRMIRPYISVVFLSSIVIVTVICTLIERPTIRYLQPLGWLIFLIVGPLVDQIVAKLKQVRSLGQV